MVLQQFFTLNSPPATRPRNILKSYWNTLYTKIPKLNCREIDIHAGDLHILPTALHAKAILKKLLGWKAIYQLATLHEHCNKRRRTKIIEGHCGSGYIYALYTAK